MARQSLSQPEEKTSEEGHSALQLEPIRIHPPSSQANNNTTIYRTTSRTSGPEALEAHNEPPATNNGGSGYHETGDEVYDRISSRKKVAIVAVLSFCAFLSPISSTSVLAATPEVARTYHTTGSIINVSNAGYMVCMGISPVIWGPMSQVFGRRVVSTSFFNLSISTFA